MPTVKTIGPNPLYVVWAKCYGCKRKHQIPTCDADRMLREVASWRYKHNGPLCRVEFTSPQRIIPRDMKIRDQVEGDMTPAWEMFKENTDFKLAFVASAALAVTSWATLASDTNLLAGASSAAIDNGASAVPIAQEVSARIKNGTTPTTAKEIQLHIWQTLEDSTYPDAISGSDAAITISTAGAVANALRPLNKWDSTTTTGSTYPTGWHTMAPKAIAPLFGGFLPRYWGLWIVHNTVAAFASGSVAHYKGLYIAS